MSGVNEPRRRPTSTSNFGVGRREGHDSTAFYERFTPPVISNDESVVPPFEIDDPFRTGDSRQLDLPDNSVALVVTSPPYYVGKDYELDRDHPQVPSSYGEYLRLLHEVFAECVRVLEPGGRIAVNVANLGRKPYRSLSADVIRILQDELGLLLRGEVIWKKSEGASGNCAWGSFRSASNPVLRDVTERIVIAGKGRFDRALEVKDREANHLPSENSVNSDEFMAATLDVWDIPPESARRVGHPGPFPDRAARTADPPLHLRERPGARPVHGIGHLVAGRGQARPTLRGLRPRPRLRGHRPGPGRHRHVRVPTDRDGAPAGVHPHRRRSAPAPRIRPDRRLPGPGLP